MMSWSDATINLNDFYDFNKIDKNEWCILFGASELGKYISKYFFDNNYNIKCFSDNNKLLAGNFINNIKIISIDELKTLDKNIPIIITSHFVLEIEQQLISFGFKKIYKPKQHIYVGDENDKNIVLESKNKIDQLISMLEDEKSVNTLKNIINFRLTNKISYLQEAFDASFPQYFDKGIIHLSAQEIFVDCGGFHGETTQEFISLVNNQYNKVYIFEPDFNNYLNIKKVHQDNDKVIIYQKGVDDKNEFLGFNVNGRWDACFSENGATLVEVDFLDHLIQEASFIKMDIEGYEIQGLLGAEKLIKKCKPKLAICIYHKTADLWEIPLLIKRIDNRYKLYIRHYRNNTEHETVVYAV